MVEVAQRGQTTLSHPIQPNSHSNAQCGQSGLSPSVSHGNVLTPLWGSQFWLQPPLKEARLLNPSFILRSASALTLFTLLATFTPPSDPHIRLCGLLYLTGHSCPFCGLTRALFALAKGHFAQAEHFNALAPLGFAMLFSLFFSGKAAGWLWRIGLPAFAIYGVLRFFVTQ